MKLGTFMMPNHPPHRSFAEGHDHDLNYLAFLDHIGFDEAWIGEHYTFPREPCPSPDLLVAQGLVVTKSMRISPGDFMLPCHHMDFTGLDIEADRVIGDNTGESLCNST